MSTPLISIVSKLSALPLVVLGALSATPAKAADFQQYLAASCANTICKLDFPVVPAGKTLRITNTSCHVRITSASSLPDGSLFALQLLLVKKDGNVGMAATLPAVRTVRAVFTPGVYTHVYQSNEQVLISARGGQHMQSYAQASEGEFSWFACHISGKLS